MAAKRLAAMFEQKEQESRAQNAKQRMPRSSASKPLNNGVFTSKSPYYRQMQRQQQTKQDQDTKSQAQHQPLPHSNTTASSTFSPPKHTLPTAQSLNASASASPPNNAKPLQSSGNLTRSEMYVYSLCGDHCILSP